MSLQPSIPSICTHPDTLASLLEIPALDNTFGALLLGTFGGLLLFGVTAHQAYRYFHMYTADGWVLKGLVTVVVFVETVTGILSMHVCYYYLVKNYFKPQVLLRGVWSIDVFPLLSGISMALSQSFFARRIWLVAPSYKPLVVVAWLVSAGSTMAVTADTLLTAVLIIVLRKSRTGVKRTDSMIDVMIMYSVNTGFLTGVFNLLSMLFSFTQKTNLIWIAFGIIGAKMYGTTLLAALNSRQSLAAHGRGISNETSPFGVSGISDPPPRSNTIGHVPSHRVPASMLRPVHSTDDYDPNGCAIELKATPFDASMDSTTPAGAPVPVPLDSEAEGPRFPEYNHMSSNDGNPPWLAFNPDGSIHFGGVPERILCHPGLQKRGITPVDAVKPGVAFRSVRDKIIVKALNLDTEELQIYERLIPDLATPANHIVPCEIDREEHPLLIMPMLWDITSIIFANHTPHSRLLHVFYELVEGVEYLHRSNIAHMDICYDNAMVALPQDVPTHPELVPRRVYLIDFDSARQLNLGPGVQPAIDLPPTQADPPAGLTYFDPYSWDVYCLGRLFETLADSLRALCIVPITLHHISAVYTMPVSPEVAAGLQWVAHHVSNINDVLYFDRTRHTRDITIPYNGRTFHFAKTGFSELGSFTGIGYEVRMMSVNKPGAAEQVWTIWVANPSSDVAVNRRAAVAGIYAIINETHAGKVAWTIDAKHYVTS
ncbi:hypothetical protein ACG7TL_001790 [Trametes sanguinea]